MSTATTPAPAPPAAPPAAPPVTSTQPPPAPAPTPPPAPPNVLKQNPVTSEVQKPGYATTEFWMSAFALISTIGVGIFHWNSQQSEDWPRITGQLAPILSIVVGFLITRQYVNQRGEIKKMMTATLGGDQLKNWLATLAQGGITSAPAVEGTVAASPGAGLSGRFTTVGGIVVVVQDGKIVQIG